MSMSHQLIPPGKSNDYHFNPLPVCHRWGWPSILWRSAFEEGRLPKCTTSRGPLALGPAWYSCYPCLVFFWNKFCSKFDSGQMQNQLMSDIWAWNSFKQCPAEKPDRFNLPVWIVTFTEATTKFFVKCMLCCIWQHEWEAARSDQGWTSHLTSKMKGKIGHYRRCIQTTKHKTTLA